VSSQGKNIMEHGVWLLILVLAGGIVLGMLTGVYISKRSLMREIRYYRRVIRMCPMTNRDSPLKSECGITKNEDIVRTPTYVGPERRGGKNRRRTDRQEREIGGRKVDIDVVLPKEVQSKVDLE
jgi:hypothetical protein